MKTKSKINGHIIRGVVYAVFLAVAFIAASSAFDSPNKWYKSAVATIGYGSAAKSPSQPRAISFAERVAFQRAIEDVYWRHRIWPKENPNPKPSLDAVMSQAQLENKVTSYLRDSLALENYWQRPITAEQLQAEMNRMARDTKQSEVLRELFEALGNDPAVIAECLARPILAEHLIADLSAQDQARYVESPQTDALATSVTTLAQGVYTLPEIAATGDPPCPDDTWTATTTANAPSARDTHTAVWTGSEMIVWGGYDYSIPGPTNTGGKYNPSTDSWTATSLTNASTARDLHTAVWTGSEMIVWGGEYSAYTAGGRYNPSTDSWRATSTTNAPFSSVSHTAVWTGSEMIIWGGCCFVNTGGRYNPKTDSWTATSTTNAPFARWHHTAVWTGSEMIVWGGDDSGGSTNTGGTYSPITDSWTTTSTASAPTARENHTAVWTGSEMIVWGGARGRGGKYNPVTDRWATTTLTNAPPARRDHTAVWTGREMIVWGGYEYSVGQNSDTGGRYNPSTDSWAPTSTSNAPLARIRHKAVWTGSEMIVWGGLAKIFGPTGGRYCAYMSPHLGNISTRAFVQTGDNVVIGGFMVQGTQPNRVIIRAIGSELTQYGVPNALPNPTLELHNGTGALIASNDNWTHTLIGGIITRDQVTDIRNSGYAPTDERESAIIAELPAGNYTAIVRGVNNTMGVALAEVYDLGPESNSVLGNVSTRALVQVGDNVMIGGFITQGTQPKRVIVRAIGPSLSQYGVPNVLANPTLELHDGIGTLIALNNNWATTIVGGIITSNQVHEIQASGYAPHDGRESAIIADLTPGDYTAIVRGVNNTTGVALVEVYDLD